MPSLYPEDIFNDALELPLEQRAAFVDRLCAVDLELRREVESLLRIAQEQPELLSMVPPPVLPERLGRYRVLDLCGRGGMGIVYRAEDPELGRIVALKLLASPQVPGVTFTRRRTNSRERLQREARLLASLNHPNIATVYSLEHVDGAPILVMEYVEGRTLAELLREDRLSVEERVRICQAVAGGIEAAHRRGIVHLDLKPANVLVRDDGAVKVLDFGIARVLGLSDEAEEQEASQAPKDPGHAEEAEGDPASTLMTTAAGTPGYMSPEQGVRGRVDHRADLWAFGALLQHCFAEETRSSKASADDRSAGDPFRFQHRGIPRRARRRLECLASSCQRSDPAERPRSMTEVRRAMDRILEGVRPSGLVGNRWTWIVAAAGLAVALGGIHLSESRRPVPVTARSRDRAVEVRYGNGRTTFFSAPDSVACDLDTALVLPAGTHSDDRVVVAYSRRFVDRGSHLMFWDCRGRLIAAVRETGDTPFTPAGEPGQRLYTEKFFQETRLADNQPGRLITLESAHYYPCALRRFEFGPEGVIEVQRLYHAGHINRVVYSSGVGRMGRLLWISGRIRDGGVLRSAAGGRERNTSFIACLDAAAVGTSVLPPFVEPDSVFLAGHPEGVQPADPILYFVVRCFADRGEFVDWDAPGSVFVDDVAESGPDGLAVLLGGATRLDLQWQDDSRLRVSASTTGPLSGVMERRAQRTHLPREELTRRFFADSVFSLAAAKPGLDVTGDFRDIRGRLPERWRGTGRRNASPAENPAWASRTRR